jgi:hypothetical protein
MGRDERDDLIAIINQPNEIEGRSTMNPQDHDLFWNLYEKQARQPIERACIFASRTKTDSTMDIADMVGWIDTRIWNMLEKSSWPTFHDDPTPQQAIDRIVKHASTLARWSYLSLCRSHFRRLENRTNYMGGLSRAQRLSMASSVDTKIEKREELDQAIDSLRNALSSNEKQRLAASWIDKEDRSRVALVIGATRKEDDLMITKINGEAINDNTVQQMRSRARKRAQEILNASLSNSKNTSSKLSLLLLAGITAISIGFTSIPSIAGEQTGGRKGMRSATVSCIDSQIDSQIDRDMLDSDVHDKGEQSGGRKP